MSALCCAVLCCAVLCWQKQGYPALDSDVHWTGQEWSCATLITVKSRVTFFHLHSFCHSLFHSPYPPPPPPPHTHTSYDSATAQQQQQHNLQTGLEHCGYRRLLSPNQVKGFHYYGASMRSHFINSELEDGNLKSFVSNTHTHAHTNHPSLTLCWSPSVASCRGYS